MKILYPHLLIFETISRTSDELTLVSSKKSPAMSKTSTFSFSQTSKISKKTKIILSYNNHAHDCFVREQSSRFFRSTSESSEQREQSKLVCTLPSREEFRGTQNSFSRCFKTNIELLSGRIYRFQSVYICVICVTLELMNHSCN